MRPPDPQPHGAARRAARAHGELVTALYGGERHDLDGASFLYNRYLEEPRLSHLNLADVPTESVAAALDEPAWRTRLTTARDFFHRRQRVPALVVDLGTTPSSLPELLGRDGWTESFRARGLLYPSQALLPPYEWPASATIEELASPAPEAALGIDDLPVEPIPFVLEGELPPTERRAFPSMDAFVAVFVAAFADTAPGESFLGYRRAIPAGFERPLPGVELVHTVVSIDGEPAAVGSRAQSRGVAGLFNLGVAPRFRGQGLGAAVTLHRVAEARAAGAEVVYVLTDDEGVEAAHRKRGFEPGFELVGWTEARAET